MMISSLVLPYVKKQEVSMYVFSYCFSFSIFSLFILIFTTNFSKQQEGKKGILHQWFYGNVYCV